MTNPAAASPARSLRVAIAARDPERRAALTRLLEALGHVVVMVDEAADAVLADQERPRDSDRPRVALGGADTEAQGLVPETASPAEIDAALRAVAQGLLVRPAVARTAGFGAAPESEPPSLLTPREAQVLDAIADGLTNKAIARRLGISLHTVKFHVESVFRKLDARTRTEAVARAMERRRQETIEL